MTEALALEHLREWIGRTEQTQDDLSPWTANAMAALLRNAQRPRPTGHALPALWHWSYFLPTVPQDGLGIDGHPARGGFLPPVPLPRRMWAGSQLEFFAPLRTGEPSRKTSTVTDVALKEGKAGALVFVKVQHEIHDAAGTLLLREAQDIVYREAARPGEPPAPVQAPPTEPAWSVEHQCDPTLLFRYGALTFNAHRIHYDLPYATRVEGYEGLVVHGPLVATLMLEAAQRLNPGLTVSAFRFRAVRPLICNRRLIVRGCTTQADGTATLWAEDGQGALLQQASVTFSQNE